jgi:hypothetical protein
MSPSYPVPVNGEIRYVGFRPAGDGGRQFEFAVRSASRQTAKVVLVIPGAVFAGPNRLLVQEGAGICMAKLRSLYALAVSEALPPQIQISEDDIREYREVIIERTPWGSPVAQQPSKTAEDEGRNENDRSQER